jgi:hypothetical protein
MENYIDGGSNWKNISDKYFGSSIGSVAVAPSDESVLYVGEGENTLRGNVSEGLGGIWRSDDGGRSWKNIGLKDARHIIRIIIHPRDPEYRLGGCNRAPVRAEYRKRRFQNNRRRQDLEKNIVHKRSGRSLRPGNGTRQRECIVCRNMESDPDPAQHGKWR